MFNKVLTYLLTYFCDDSCTDTGTSITTESTALSPMTECLTERTYVSGFIMMLKNLRNNEENTSHLFTFSSYLFVYVCVIEYVYQYQ